MARDLKAKIRLEADTRQANKALSGVTSSVKSMVSAFAAGAVGVAALTQAFRASFAAALEQEAAVASLNGQLRSLGAASLDVSASLQAQASALQQVSTFGDDQIIRAQAALAAFTKEEEQLKELTKATLDFATASGTSLTSAAALVAKSFGSSTNALTRYGIEVEGSVGSTERLIQITEGIADLWGGQALAASETFSGQLELLNNNIGDVGENFVEVGTQSENLIGILKFLNEEIAKSAETWDKIPEPADRFRKAVLNLTEVVMPNMTRLVREQGIAWLGWRSDAQVAEEQAKRLADEQKKLANFTDVTAIAAKEAGAAWENLNKIIAEQVGLLSSDLPGSVEDTLGALEKIGVVLETEVNREVAEGNALLLQAEELYRRGVITREEFEAAERLVAESIRESNQSLEDQSEGLELSGRRAFEYTEAVNGARYAVDELTTAEIRNTETVISSSERRRAAVAQERSEFSANLLGGQSGFSQIKGGTFFIPAPVVELPNGRIETVTTVEVRR